MATLKGFPKRFKDTKTEDCVGERWLEYFVAVHQLLKQGGIAVFTGDCGVGKTRMAYELAKIHKERTEYVYGLNKICPATYTTADKMLEALRSSYSNDNDAKSERNVVDELAAASLLVIDELDNSVKSEFGQRKLKRIVDERYMGNLPAIIITNHDKNKLSELLPKQVISRIRENGKGFYFDWPSFRC